jgi:hypothetical protein
LTPPSWYRLGTKERTPCTDRRDQLPPCPLLALVFLVASASSLRGQEAILTDSIAPVLDSIAIVTENVFSPEEAQNTGIFRVANGFRFKTHHWVVSREVLLEVGQPYDSLLAAETERNLRRLGLFRQVDVDTSRVDGKLVATVHTRDSWSTQPIVQLSVASDGTWTGRFGLTESNLLGTGNIGHVAWRKDVDRDGLEFATELRRVAGSEINVGGRYFNLSDGNFGDWFAGDPWRSFSDRHSVTYRGEAADRQALQYRVESGDLTDTTRYWRNNYAHRLVGGIATRATPRAYTRIGVVGEYRNQKYVLVSDTSQAVPDTIQGFVGVFGEYRRSQFMVTRFLNGFMTQDIDLSESLSLGLTVAPSAFGFPETGLGPSLSMQAGSPLGDGFVHGRLDANGLFNSAGLDSGRVMLRVTVAQKPGVRHATVLHARAGIMENPPPGGEFDLGFEFPPRSWSPHSFVGTRTVWGTLEHRWFPLDQILSLAGLGLAGFLDYGGAWYADQSPRWGGAVGFGIRTGWSRTSVADTGRIDIGYRFGSDVTGNRWVISFGGGWIFP